MVQLLTCPKAFALPDGTGQVTLMQVGPKAQGALMSAVNADEVADHSRLSSDQVPIGLSNPGAPRRLRVGVVNNMPDAAIQRTESQFSALLQASAGCLPLSIEYYSLPDVPRADEMRERLAASYTPYCELWSNRPDAIIITGTEPRQRYLTDEVYWDSFAGLIDWIDRKDIPTFYSCLAAHAAVLRLEGVDRVPLHNKRFGIFDHEVAPDHPLMDGVGLRMVLPHTRWNEVPETALVGAGYEVLSWSPDAGVGFFARRGTDRQLFCQGHPEYDSENLLREYRRDVSRFLTGEQSSYPNLPQSYFDELETRQLNAFKQRALAQPGLAAMDAFPCTVKKRRACGSWGAPAIRIFNNWLRHAAMFAQSADLHLAQ